MYVHLVTHVESFVVSVYNCKNELTFVTSLCECPLRHDCTDQGTHHELFGAFVHITRVLLLCADCTPAAEQGGQEHYYRYKVAPSCRLVSLLFPFKRIYHSGDSLAIPSVLADYCVANLGSL